MLFFSLFKNPSFTSTHLFFIVLLSIMEKTGLYLLDYPLQTRNWHLLCYEIPMLWSFFPRVHLLSDWERGYRKGEFRKLAWLDKASMIIMMRKRNTTWDGLHLCVKTRNDIDKNVDKVLSNGLTWSSQKWHDGLRVIEN